MSKKLLSLLVMILIICALRTSTPREIILSKDEASREGSDSKGLYMLNSEAEVPRLRRAFAAFVKEGQTRNERKYDLSACWVTAAICRHSGELRYGCFSSKGRWGCGCRRRSWVLAAGVMIAAAVWSLLIPAMEMGGAGAFCRHCHTERSGGRHRLQCRCPPPECAEGQGFLCGGGVSVVEPIGALLTILLLTLLTPMLPYLLTSAAGAMIYVVVEELDSEAQAGEHSNIGTIGAALGFAR